VKAEDCVGRRFGPDGAIEVVGLAGRDKYRHDLVVIKCWKCGRDDKVMRLDDLTHKATCSSSGKVRKPNGSCGCESKAEFKKYVQRKIARFPREKRVIIWAEAQGRTTTTFALAGKYGIEKYVVDEIVRQVNRDLRELDRYTKKYSWFQRCCCWKEQLESEWAHPWENPSTRWQPITAQSCQKNSKRLRTLLNRPHGCFTRAEMTVTGGHILGGRCRQIIGADRILEKWGYLLSISDPIVREECKRQSLPAMKYVEMASWINKTKNRTFKVRALRQKQAIARRKLRDRLLASRPQRALASARS